MYVPIALSCSSTGQTWKSYLSLVVTARSLLLPPAVLDSVKDPPPPPHRGLVFRAQELCESRGGRLGLPSLISLRFLWTLSIMFTYLLPYPVFRISSACSRLLIDTEPRLRSPAANRSEEILWCGYFVANRSQ